MSSALFFIAIKKEKPMRIATGKLIAGYPAVKVRNFLRWYRDTVRC